MGRIGMIALAASLAANVFLGGFVAGRVLGPADAQRVAEPVSERPGQRRWAGEPGEMSPAAREAFRKAYLDRRSDLTKGREQARAARRAFLDIAGAERWDRAAAENALGEINATERSREAVRMSALLDALESMPVEERRAWVQRRTERLDSGRFRDDARRERDRSTKFGEPLDDASSPKK